MYQALYRTYRPKDFDDMVGQKHIVVTIKNAIVNNRISHAYLFTGPRGTGKTSSALIVAKAINCLDNINGNPCNKCINCISINEQTISDIIEIDGASNNGVEEIRDLKEKINYAPALCKYKVYIIDEVHMLSTGAFNALLKTLEEPPKHVIFILATTEPHKVPATIISRTQRFDFRKFPVNEIEQRLVYILNDENLEFENQAIEKIAVLADGGMRDALTILDQVIAYSDGSISLNDVDDVMGTVSKDKLISIYNTINIGHTKNLLLELDEILLAGKDPIRFCEDFISLLTDILIENYENKILYSYISELSEALKEMKQTNYPKIYLEIALIKLSQMNIEFKDKQDFVSTPVIDVVPKVIKDEVIEDVVIEDEVIEDEVIEDEVIEDVVIEDKVIEDGVIEDEVIEDEVIENKTTFIAQTQMADLNFEDSFMDFLDEEDNEKELTHEELTQMHGHSLFDFTSEPVINTYEENKTFEEDLEFKSLTTTFENGEISNYDENIEKEQKQHITILNNKKEPVVEIMKEQQVMHNISKNVDIINVEVLEKPKTLHDVRINNVFALANKDILLKVKEDWSKISDYIFDPDYGGMCSIIKEGVIRVTSEEIILLSFTSVSFVNYINQMVEENKKLTLKIIGKSYKIIGVDEKTWIKLKDEYVSKIKSKEIYHYIDEKNYTEQLKKIKEYQESTKKAIELFGEDIIEIKGD